MDVVKWMKRNKITAKIIAEETGKTQRAVRGYLCGAWSSSRIENWLSEHGCPQEAMDVLRAKREEKRKFRRPHTWRKIQMDCPFEQGKIEPYVPGVHCNSAVFCPLV
jgi:hypothetical protein